MTIRILALVGDAYGGLGGIARYNCDLFQALSAAGAEILVMPRLGDATGVLPPGVRQWPAIRSRLGFSLAAVVARVAPPADRCRILRPCFHGTSGAGVVASAGRSVLAAGAWYGDLA